MDKFKLYVATMSDGTIHVVPGLNAIEAERYVNEIARSRDLQWVSCEPSESTAEDIFRDVVRIDTA